MSRKEKKNAVIEQMREERKQTQQEERKEQGRAGRFFKYIAKKMCGRNDDIAADEDDGGRPDTDPCQVEGRSLTQEAGDMNRITDPHQYGCTELTVISQLSHI